MSKPNCNRGLLRVLDVLFSITWVAHLVVACWRGTWNLLDLYVLPGDLVSGTWISFLGGVILCTAVRAAFPSMHRNILAKQKILKALVSRFMIYIMAWATIGQWRGVWYILNRHTGLEWRANLFTFSLGLVLLWLFRASVDAVAQPFGIGYDFRDDIFIAIPRLKTSHKRYWDYIIDHFLSMLIFESLIICIWRSLWNIFDDLVLPDNFLHSNLITWIGGIFAAFILIALEDSMAYLSKNSRRCGFGCKLLIENFYTALCFAATVALWRGWWNILEGILLPGLLFGGVICHCVGVTCLLCTGTLSSLVRFSFSVDGEQKSGLHWSIGYFQLIFPKEDEKTTTEQKKAEENNNDAENLLRHSRNGDYIKCSPEFEVEDLKLTSI